MQTSHIQLFPKPMISTVAAFIQLLMCFICLSAISDEKEKKTEIPELLADATEWPESLKKSLKELDENQRLYVAMVLLNTSPVSLATEPVLIQGSLVVFGGELTVNQIVSNKDFITKYMNHSLWVSGVDTTALTDDSIVNINNVFKISGNQSYTTVLGGSKTVLKLEVVNTEKADVFIQSVLNRRGYRMFRTRSNIRVIAHVSLVSKTSATLLFFGKKKPVKVGADYFSENDLEWLNDKDNLAAMKKSKKEWDAAERDGDKIKKSKFYEN